MGKGTVENVRKFTRVELQDELRADTDGMPVFRECFENEIMMAFYDDLGAYYFKEWWESRGALLFGEWCVKSNRAYLL